MIRNWDMNDDFINAANPGTYNGTKVEDLILCHGCSEFTTRLRYEPTTPLVVADDVSISTNKGTGYAVIVKAA